jgi:hypothetical protein
VTARGIASLIWWCLRHPRRVFIGMQIERFMWEEGYRLVAVQNVAHEGGVNSKGGEA